MARAIFHTHQTIGTCAGVGVCDCTHQTEKTKRKRKKTFWSADKSVSSPHSGPVPCPASSLQSRGSSKMPPTPVSHTSFLSAVCICSVFHNLGFFLRGPLSVYVCAKVQPTILRLAVMGLAPRVPNTKNWFQSS